MKRIECTIPMFDEKITQPDTAFELLEKYYKTLDCNQEHFCIELLNSSNQILKIIEISRGGVDEASVDLKIVFYHILTTPCVKNILLSHNHPSGNFTPSQPDIYLTNRIKEACELFEINLFDHIILTEHSGHTSFSERGLL